MYLEKTKKRGRSIEEKGETSERELKKKGLMCPSEPNQPSSGDVKLKSPMCPIQPYSLDLKLDSPNKDYLNELPLYIREYVISTEDVPPDGNCGFHVVNQQLGPFIEELWRPGGPRVRIRLCKIMQKVMKDRNGPKIMPTTELEIWGELERGVEEERGKQKHQWILDLRWVSYGNVVAETPKI
ncbi:hypothetical protein C5167_041527 [Papaver somniferum]|nr:hypothetical protein C5167_041527 [Papaver somniferum]